MIGPADEGVDADLIGTLVRRAVCCPCPHPARIAISYEPGTTSEGRAQSVRSQLKASRHDMLVTLELGAAQSAGQSARHYCVIFDAARGTLE